MLRREAVQRRNVLAEVCLGWVRINLRGAPRAEGLERVGHGLHHLLGHGMEVLVGIELGHVLARHTDLLGDDIEGAHGVIRELLKVLPCILEWSRHLARCSLSPKENPWGKLQKPQLVRKSFANRQLLQKRWSVSAMRLGQFFVVLLLCAVASNRKPPHQPSSAARQIGMFVAFPLTAFLTTHRGFRRSLPPFVRIPPLTHRLLYLNDGRRRGGIEPSEEYPQDLQFAASWRA